MGMDMYFSACMRASADSKAYKALLKVFGLNPIPDSIAELSLRFFHTKNAFHVHDWLVKTVSYGRDPEQGFTMERRDLEDLVIQCKRVVNHKTKSGRLLPLKGRRSKIENERCYFEAQYAIEHISPILENPKYAECGFYYVIS